MNSYWNTINHKTKLSAATIWSSIWCVRQLSHKKPLETRFIIPPANKVWGVYRNHPVRPCTLQVQLILNYLLNFYETLHSCSTQPADVQEGLPLLSKIPKFEHHSIASGGYHSVRSLTVLVYFVDPPTSSSGDVTCKTVSYTFTFSGVQIYF